MMARLGGIRFICGAFAVPVAWAYAAGALAQDQGAQPSDEDHALSEVVVTAQKREQSLEKVPISIDVVTGDMLAQRQTDTLSKLASVVPGFEFGRAPSDIPGITFRGIGTQAGNVAFDNSIGMFVDGVFMGNVRLYGQTLFDTARVELIKGTQSTLLGKNTSLGALSIVNQRPDITLGGRLEAGGEAVDGGYFADGALNFPLSDELSVRFAGRYSHTNGWVENRSTGQRVPIDTDSGARVSVSYRPNDAFDVLLSYQHTENNRVGSATQVADPGLSALGLGAGPPVGPANFGTDYKNAYSSNPALCHGDDCYRNRVDMPVLTASYDLGPASLTSITAGAWFDNVDNADFDFDDKDDNLYLRNERYHQFSQELRIASNGNRSIDYLAGIYYFTSTWHQLQNNVWGIPDFPPAPSALSGQLFNGSFANLFNQKTDSYSGYGQLNFHVSEALSVNVGMRYSHERKIVDFGRTPEGQLTLWNTVINAPFAYQRLPEVTDNLPSGSLSLQYQLAPSHMLYVSASRGGKSGGYGEFNTIPLDPAIGAGNPARDARVGNERANSYEIGLKSSLLDRRMLLNAALFWTDVFGLQQLVFTSDGLFVSSNDRARSRGMEGSLDYQLSSQWRWTTSVTFADAKQLNPDLRLAQSPRWSGSSHLDWNHSLPRDFALTLGAAVRYRSSKFNQLGEALETGSYTTLALTGRLEAAHGWYVNIDAENVTNSKGADFGFPGPDPFVAKFQTLAPLRTVRISLGTRF